MQDASHAEGSGLLGRLALWYAHGAGEAGECGGQVDEKDPTGERTEGPGSPAGPGGRRLARGHGVTLDLLNALWPALRRVAAHPIPAAVGRRALDLVLPAGRHTVATVRGGPLEGCRLRLDPRRQKEMIFGSYEPDVQRALTAHAGPGDVAFDVGAHLGFFTLLLSRRVGASGRVVAVEPDPFMADQLQTNLDLNQAGNVVTVRAAVSSSPGELHFSPGAGGGTGHVAAHGPLAVEATTLDDLSNRFGPPRVVKVDVEGGELEVLRGGTETLTHHRPALLLEIHEPEDEEAAGSLLSLLGYQIRRLRPDPRLHLIALAEA
jgi:FkbM family methyltransferase